jgi:thiol-disulfide isomerase/thioredoxin
VNLTLLGLALPKSEALYYDSYTHALFDEHFTATWCPSCRTDEPNVLKAYNDLAGSLFIVSYHVSDEWSNPTGDSMVLQYQAHTIPYHVFDGGYWIGKGGIYNTDMEDPAARPVHRIGLAIRKFIHGSNLEYEGSVQEMDGKVFNGYVQVYITENRLQSEGIEWNFVFRDFGVNQMLSMSPGAIVQFSGTWIVPSNVKANNLLAVAAVFDKSTTGPYGSYAVQAIDDSRSGQVIPEMSSPFGMAVVVLVITLFAVFRIKRSAKSEFRKCG